MNDTWVRTTEPLRWLSFLDGLSCMPCDKRRYTAVWPVCDSRPLHTTGHPVNAENTSSRKLRSEDIDVEQDTLRIPAGWAVACP